MAYTLHNQNIEIKIEAPLENYNAARFDWTGKIADVKFKDIQMAGIEDPNYKNDNLIGKGFYNEFGIDTALGFEEAQIGGWFHKIGVGLLKKEDSEYAFNKSYEINPAKFKVSTTKESIMITCLSDTVNGYSYELHKNIELQESGFTITYYLENTGTKTIHTNEYTHNFLTINNDFIGENYSLKFPFELKPNLFTETVNSEEVVVIEKNRVTFNGTPIEQFFFGNLSGGESVRASWELINLKTKIGIREISSFQTQKVNLWGWKHVISPELFIDIKVAPGKSAEWTRRYELFHI